MTAGISFEFDAGIAALSGGIALRFDGHDLSFHAEVTARCASVTAHVGVTVDTNGCMSVEDVGHICL